MVGQIKALTLASPVPLPDVSLLKGIHRTASLNAGHTLCCDLNTFIVAAAHVFPSAQKPMKHLLRAVPSFMMPIQCSQWIVDSKAAS